MTLPEYIAELERQAAMFRKLEAGQRRVGASISADNSKDLAQVLEACLRLAREIKQ